MALRVTLFCRGTTSAFISLTLCFTVASRKNLNVKSNVFKY